MGEPEAKPTPAETRQHCLDVLERCARGEKIDPQQLMACRAWLAETRGLFNPRAQKVPAAMDVPKPIQLADDVTRPQHVGLSPRVTSRSTGKSRKVPRK